MIVFAQMLFADIKLCDVFIPYMLDVFFVFDVLLQDAKLASIFVFF
jgi:hypothetical protein